MDDCCENQWVPLIKEGSVAFRFSRHQSERSATLFRAKKEANHKVCFAVRIKIMHDRCCLYCSFYIMYENTTVQFIGL